MVQLLSLKVLMKMFQCPHDVCSILIPFWLIQHLILVGYYTLLDVLHPRQPSPNSDVTRMC
jgi:hypothetical protein